MNWKDYLLWLLCLLGQVWGVECEDAENDEHEAAAIVARAYDTQGAPKFNSAAEEAAFLGLLSGLERHMDSSESTLSQAEADSLYGMISALRAGVSVGSP